MYKKKCVCVCVILKAIENDFQEDINVLKKKLTHLPKSLNLLN